MTPSSLARELEKRFPLSPRETEDLARHVQKLIIQGKIEAVAPYTYQNDKAIAHIERLQSELAEVDEKAAMSFTMKDMEEKGYFICVAVEETTAPKKSTGRKRTNH